MNENEDIDPRQVACAKAVARRFGVQEDDVETFGENNSDVVTWEIGRYSGLWIDGEIREVQVEETD